MDILIVEDNPADAWLMRDLLGALPGYAEVNLVTDGEQAIDYLFRRGAFAGAKRPDVVLLDLNLPKKGGIEVLRELKADTDLATIPIIVLSTSSQPEDIQRSYQHHASAYFTKPGNLADFEVMVRQLTTVEIPRLIRVNG